MMDWQNWTLDIEHVGEGHAIATLTLAVAGKSVNVLTRAVIDELTAVLAVLESDTSITGMILCSGKPGFVYGADITEFSALKDENSVAALVAEVHGLFNRLAALPYPTVAVIDGYALGGGLELALTCDRLLATDSPKTRLAFPEVTLGLMPGYGGSGRAWARIGTDAVLDMMLTGRMVGAHEAAQIGLIDGLIAEGDDPILMGRDALMACRGVKPAPGDPTSSDPTPGDPTPGDPASDVSAPGVSTSPQPESDATIAAAIESARQKHLTKLRPDHTPAPFAIIDHIARHAPDAAAISAAELLAFPVLMVSPASDGLRRVFGLKDMLRKDARGGSGVAHIHVIGAGVMGGDIAAVAAMEGLEVTLFDLSAEALQNAATRADALFERRLKTPDKIEAAKSRLVLDPEQNGLAKADLVIEAVAEKLAIKQEVFAAIEGKSRPDAILATNTSAIPLEEIASVLKTPQRFVGIHFFNPVPVLPLVEIIASSVSDADIIRRAMCFAGSLRKMPIACKSSPGFLVNRALLPYVLKAIEMMEGGTDPDKIDQAMIDFGMPMGPIELADQIGLDITRDASTPLGLPPVAEAALATRIEAGNLGRKSGQGFYVWDGKHARRPRGDYDAGALHALAHALLAPMIDQCRQAVAEGVVASADHADAGMIFGVGFPAFRGGPLHYDDRLKQGGA